MTFCFFCVKAKENEIFALSQTDRHYLYPPLYTITQYKTIPILAGVGGGGSTFYITQKQRHTDGQCSCPDWQAHAQAAIPKSPPEYLCTSKLQVRWQLWSCDLTGEPATPTGNARNPRSHQRQRSCPACQSKSDGRSPAIHHHPTQNHSHPGGGRGWKFNLFHYPKTAPHRWTLLVP